MTKKAPAKSPIPTAKVRTDPAGSPAEPPRDPAYRLGGYIDFHGYHSLALGWFICGWISYPWPAGHQPEKLAAIFNDQSVVGCKHMMFYGRDDIRGRGIGFVFFFPTGQSSTLSLLTLLIEIAGIPNTIYPSPAIGPSDETELAALLKNVFSRDERGVESRHMQSLLSRQQSSDPATGAIDVYSYHETAGGWFCNGWTSRAWAEGSQPFKVELSFETGRSRGDGFAVLYPRHDLQDAATGLLLFVASKDEPEQDLKAITFEADGKQTILAATPATMKVPGPRLLGQMHTVLEASAPGPHRDALLALSAKHHIQADGGMDAAKLFIDEAILCGTSGVVLAGWYIASTDGVPTIRVRCGSIAWTVDPGRCIWVDRPDVINSLGLNGHKDTRCGFVAWLPEASVPDARIYIEAGSSYRQSGCCDVLPLKLVGIDAIRRLLASVEIRFAEVRPAFDCVLGPAIEVLNRSRLAIRPRIEVIEYGIVDPNPRFSVVIPLHGRLDFVEYQLAFFSTYPGNAGVEFIYVLDDPAQRREARQQFPLLFERFRIPFKALLLDRNVGYAPATNIGLEHACGEFVAFLNSDVFPATPDWLDLLSGRMLGDPDIGVIGPVLLFEDGSIQHCGTKFVRIPEFGDFHFAVHIDKGLRPSSPATLETHASITGACMLMRRDLAIEIGGFDQAYVLGDFEDSDLCLRIQARGYRCVVDPQVRLIHLERQSQIGPDQRWRMNLTVYNAWQHETRWGATIEAKWGAP